MKLNTSKEDRKFTKCNHQGFIKTAHYFIKKNPMK